MTTYTKNEVLSGAFILVALLILAFLTFSNTGLPFFTSRLECQARFDTVGALQPGAKVKVAGCEVGVVKSIRLEHLEGQPTRVLVHFRIESNDDLIISPGVDGGTLAAIRNDGLLGDPYVALLSPPASDGDDFRAVSEWIEKKGSEVVLFKGVAPQDLVGMLKAEVIEPVRKELVPTLQNVRRLSEKLDAGMEEDGPLGRVFVGLEKTVDESLLLVKDARRLIDQGLQAQIVKPAGELIRHLDAEVSTFSPELRGLIAKSGKLLDASEEDLAVLKQLLVRGDGILEENEKHIRTLLVGLDETSRSLRKDIGELREQLVTLGKETRSTLRDARPEVQETLRRLRRAAWEMELAIRRVRGDPSLLLWGGGDAPPIPVEADEGRLREAGRAKPLGTRGDG